MDVLLVECAGRYSPRQGDGFDWPASRAVGGQQRPPRWSVLLTGSARCGDECPCVKESRQDAADSQKGGQGPELCECQRSAFSRVVLCALVPWLHMAADTAQHGAAKAGSAAFPLHIVPDAGKREGAEYRTPVS